MSYVVKEVEVQSINELQSSHRLLFSPSGFWFGFFFYLKYALYVQPTPPSQIMIHYRLSL